MIKKNVNGKQALENVSLINKLKKKEIFEENDIQTSAHNNTNRDTLRMLMQNSEREPQVDNPSIAVMKQFAQPLKKDNNDI